MNMPFQTEEFSGKCEIHGDFSAVKIVGINIEEKDVSLYCPKCMERKKQEEISSIIQIRKTKTFESRYKKMFDQCCIPKRFIGKTLDNYECDSNEKKDILEKAREYAKNFAKYKELGSSRILFGGVGTGKTHIAIGIAQEVMQSGYSAVFSTVGSLFLSARETYKNHSDFSEKEILQTFIDADFLILDEIGVQKGSDYEQNLLFHLLNRRYEEMLPTFLLSNLTIKGMEEILGSRIMDRLRENGGEAWVFGWKSYRGKS